MYKFEKYLIENYFDNIERRFHQSLVLYQLTNLFTNIISKIKFKECFYFLNPFIP
jgi:hypothetical protein